MRYLGISMLMPALNLTDKIQKPSITWHIIMKLPLVLPDGEKQKKGSNLNALLYFHLIALK